MEALHSLQKQELQWQTVREVKMHISKTQGIPYDSFFILDQSDKLITADKPIEDSVSEIKVYSLQTYLYKTKRIIVELRQNIQKLDNARFQDSQLAKETAETNFKDLEKAKQDLEDTKKQHENKLSEKQKEFNDQKEKLDQEIIQLNKKQQEAQTDFSTKIENQRKDYEQKIQNIQTEAIAKLEESNKQFQAQQQTMQQRFDEQIAQANKNSEAELKKQNDESNDKFQKANNDFNEKISSLQQKYDHALQSHKDNTLKLKNELQNQINQFEEEQSRLSKIINDTKKKLNEDRQQFEIQQLTSKSEFEKKLKDLQTEKDSAIETLKYEFYKEKEYFGTERQQNLDQRQYIELQIKQLTESKQQNEQTIAQYTQDLQASNLENIKLKYSIEELNRNLAQQVEYINQQKTQFEAQIQNMKQSFEQFQQDTYYQVQALQYQLNQAQQQGQQLQYQIFQLTEEKTILETQSQNNDKKNKQTISELEQQHETEIEQFRQKLKSSKTANEELEATNQKLIKDKNSIQIELQEKLDELQRANKKYKTLESDYEISKGKVTGDAELQLEQLRVVLREEKNKNESLIVELQKIPQLQKKIDQTELEFQKKKAQNDEEKQQLENQIAQIKKELQTMTANKIDVQNQLQLSKSQEQHLKDRSEKINTEKSEKDKMIQKEQEQVSKLENEKNKLKQDLNQKVIEVTSLNQQIQLLNENLAKTQTEFKEIQKQKIDIEMKLSEIEVDLATKLKEEQRQIQRLKQENDGLTKMKIHLEESSAGYEQESEELKFQIKMLKRQIKPIINQKITGLIENFSLKFKQEFSKFTTHADIQTQDYQFELFAIQIVNQAAFDQSLLKSQSLRQLSEFISFKSLGIQTIKKSVQPATDNTFFEGNIFQIANPTDEANNHNPNLKTQTFLMKTIKMLKTNGYQPKSGDEGKQLLIPNLASMSILNQFINQLINKGVKPPAFKFPQQYMMQAQTENDKYFCHIEELVDGELLKLNSSNLPLKDTPECQFSNSLVYYSFKKLQEKAMLTNIQGVKSADGTITLYDTILCSDQGLQSDIDLGNEEIVKMKDLIEKDGKKYLGDFYEKVKDEFNKK